MKRKFFIIFFFGFLLSTISAETLVQTPNYALFPDSPRRGEPFLIALDTYATEAFLLIDGKQIAKAAVFRIDDEPGAPVARRSVAGFISLGCRPRL